MTNKKTYKIVDDNDQTIDDLTGLTLTEAESELCKLCNEGADAYIQDE